MRTERRQPYASQGQRDSGETNSARTLDLRFLTSRTLRNQPLSFKPHILWYSVMAVQHINSPFPGSVAPSPELPLVNSVHLFEPGHMSEVTEPYLSQVSI